MNYINFFPGNTRDSRSVSINADAFYGLDDLVGLVDSMLAGSTSSAPVDGAKAALEDGSIWGDLSATYGDETVQAALEELHNLLPGNGSAK